MEYEWGGDYLMRVKQDRLARCEGCTEENRITQYMAVDVKVCKVDMSRFIQAKVLEIAIHNPAITASDLINALLIVDKRIGKNI